MFWRWAPISRASQATGCGLSAATMVPRICQRALVRPSPATSLSPAAIIRLLRPNSSRMRSVKAVPAGVLLASRICPHISMLTSWCQLAMSTSYQMDTMSPYRTESAMSLLRPMDPAFPIERQLGVDASPVVLVNVFTFDKAGEQTFRQVWQDDADFMRRQPGFISTQLHRAIGES